MTDISSDIPEAIYIETDLDLALSLLIGNKALHEYEFYMQCPVQVVASKGSIVIRPISHHESETWRADQKRKTHMSKKLI